MTFGLATGGIVQVVTKSGTNVLHGNLFEYFRDKSLNARGVFEDEKPEFERHQFGGSIGGAVLPDRMHYFGAAERTQVDEFYTVNTGLPQFYSSVEGTFAKPFHRNLYFGRLDWQISNAQNAFARYAHEDERSTCGGCGGTTASTAGFDQETPRRSIVVGHTWIRGTRHLNDFRFQWASAAYYIAPAGTTIFKETGSFPAERLNRLTRGYSFPSLSWGSSFDELGPESRWQFKDTYAITFDRHDLKFGFDYSYMPYEEENTGNILGSYSFSEDQYFNPDDPQSIANLRGAATFSASLPPINTSHPTKYYVGFVQDDIRLRPNLTVNLGLRYERLYGSANEDLDPSIFPITIPYIDVSSRGDRNNFGPRTGFNPRDPVTRARPNSTFARVDRNQSTAEIDYRAIYAKLEKRFSRRTQFLVTYTFTDSTDNNPGGRYLDPFDLELDCGPSNGERRHAVVASGSVLLPADITLGVVWTVRSQLPWSATAGRDLNGDGFNTDLVPGTQRNDGSRDLNLDAVNAWRVSNGRSPISEGQIDSSRINIVDVRVSKTFRLVGRTRLDLMGQVFNLFNTENLQAQYGGGRVGNALSASFGRILSARPGTQGELAVKLLW